MRIVLATIAVAVCFFQMTFLISLIIATCAVFPDKPNQEAIVTMIGLSVLANGVLYSASIMLRDEL